MWAQLWIIPLVAVVLKNPRSFAYPTGAPLSTCSSLAPVHKGALPQQSSPPYTVRAFADNGKVRVSISSSPEFQGFLLQARSKSDRNRIVQGSFSEKKDVSQGIDCPGGKKNTLTHTNASPKRGIDTVWTPAPGIDEDVIFRATVARTFDTFWTEIDSPPLLIKTDSSGEKDGAEPETIVYSSCSVTKGCFGYPPDCINREDCQVLLSYGAARDGIVFTLEGLLGTPWNYIAAGLSTDNQMGDDSVTECFLQNAEVVAQESWNRGKTNDPVRRLRNGEYEWKYTNGIGSCSWIRPYETTIKGKYFNLLNTTYHVLLATGPLNEQGNGVGYHTGGRRIASAQTVNFTAFESVGGAGIDPAIKIHGTFMVTAWIGFVSLGILLARHFKSVGENKTLCGVKLWFAFHRGFMIAALVFVVIAFIVIFVYKKGWDYNQNGRNPHAVLGCIATAFGLFQPIMAAFRPSPDDKKRPIFNWLHWAVGNAAQIIAVVTIFFARSLDAAGLKDSFYWVVAVFVVVHCFFHFVFQLHAWSLEKKKNNEIKMLELAAGRTANSATESQQKVISGKIFRVLLLGVYGIFLVVIIIALYALIGTA